MGVLHALYYYRLTTSWRRAGWAAYRGKHQGNPFLQEKVPLKPLLKNRGARGHHEGINGG